MIQSWQVSRSKMGQLSLSCSKMLQTSMPGVVDWNKSMQKITNPWARYAHSHDTIPRSNKIYMWCSHCSFTSVKLFLVFISLSPIWNTQSLHIVKKVVCGNLTSCKAPPRGLPHDARRSSLRTRSAWLLMRCSSQLQTLLVTASLCSACGARIGWTVGK